MLEGRLKAFFNQGDLRSVKAKKNIAAMIFIKGGNILMGLLMLPLTLRYVDSDTYGIWMAISSMVAWVSFFDIGINNGLKNKLAEALALNDIPLARRYVSTTYALLSLIFIPLMFLLLGIAPMLDWYDLLHLSRSSVNGLLVSVSIVITYFCLNFILSTVNIVMLADQRPAAESFRVLVQQVLSVLVIFVLTRTTEGSLVKLCLALCLCPLVVVGLFNVTLYAGRYRAIAPSLSTVDFSLAPDLFKLGIQFFIIQIAMVIQYQMTNFLIIRYFGPSDVTAYNVAFKYFSVPYMFWVTLITPVWAAVTDALAKGEMPWVRNVVRKYLLLFLLFLAGSLVMLFLATPVYRLWVGAGIVVPFAVSLWVMAFNLVMMFGSIFVNVLNGAGILKVQTIASLISPLLFLGLCFLFIRSGWGVEAILIASVISNFNGLLLAPVQCVLLFKRGEK